MSGRMQQCRTGADEEACCIAVHTVVFQRIRTATVSRNQLICQRRM